jgi:hypothetical protein
MLNFVTYSFVVIRANGSMRSEEIESVIKNAQQRNSQDLLLYYLCFSKLRLSE